MNGNFISVDRLGDAQYPSPLPLSSAWNDQWANFVPETARIRLRVEEDAAHPGDDDLYFEKAGPRAQLFFDPATVRAGIVTCGGLCPGLNAVIRSIALALHHNYGVREVLGYRYGYRGLNPEFGYTPINLTPERVDRIHEDGGTILGTSRGSQPIETMVDFLQRERISLLFCLGGDGTQRGARRIADEARRRGLALAVIGIPKTIDNDVPFVARSFGYMTAVARAHDVLDGAHMEARSVFNGVGLVKLMGREAGFLACGATLANQEVNFTLIPEVPLKLEGPGGFLAALQRRLEERHHALIAVAEGAGQDLVPDDGRDASGNRKLGDIGPFLRKKIQEFAHVQGFPVEIKYLDPSYYVRSVPADSDDLLLCDQMARHAVHAAMAGRTGCIVGYWNDAFFHVPIRMVNEQLKRVDPESDLWRSVLAATGQHPRWT